jgi:hypothetical protein
MLYINDSTSRVQELNQWSVIEVKSTYSNNIIWEIQKYPEGDVGFTPTFAGSGNRVTTQKVDDFEVMQFGTYVIKATVQNVGVYYFYLRIKSVVTGEVLPFYEEAKEVDQNKGQFEVLYDTIRKIHTNTNAGCQFQVAMMNDTTSVGTLASIDSGFMDESDDAVVQAIPYEGKGKPYLVVSKILVDNPLLPLDYTIYLLLKKGLYRANESFGISVDPDNIFYLNPNNHQISDEGLIKLGYCDGSFVVFDPDISFNSNELIEVKDFEDDDDTPPSALTTEDYLPYREFSDDELLHKRHFFKSTMAKPNRLRLHLLVTNATPPTESETTIFEVTIGSEVYSVTHTYSSGVAQWDEIITDSIDIEITADRPMISIEKKTGSYGQNVGLIAVELI